MVRSTERPPMPTARLFGEAAILLAALILTCQISFHGWLLGGQGAALFFLVFPVLLWIALRFGLRGSICGSLVVACFAIHGTIQGMGPFAGENRNSSVVLLLTFVGAVSLMSLMLTADIAQRQRAEAALRSSEQQSRELFEKVEELNQDLERRVRERTAQLEVINRELEAFCYSVSHDLRAPLRSIRGFSEVLLERYATKLDERGQEFLRRSCESSQIMDRLIEDLLKLSRVTRAELQRRPVNLSALAESIASELRSGEPARTVQFVIAPGLNAEGDERLLHLALDNLLRNAWKFTSKRAEARIEVGATAEPQPAFFVRDNGAGFDMAYAGKLFGVFQRLHSAGDFAGTGVGLATVQRIVTRHGGRAWATGEVDRGATFYFTL